MMRGLFGKGSALMTVPQRVRASAAIAQRQAYRGGLALRSLPRLQELLARSEGELQVDLQAERRHGRDHLHGSVHGLLNLQCQRCERVYGWPLQADLDLVLVQSEADEASMLQDADPYCVQEDVLPLHELIEDEVLLAMPMLPRCESCENEIQAASPAAAAEVSSEAEEAPRENPFAKLQDAFKKRS